MDTAPQTDSNGPPAPLLTLGDFVSKADQLECQSKVARVLCCVEVGALRYAQNVLEPLAQAEESRQGVSRESVTWSGTPFEILALRVLSPFDVEETDQEARLRNFAVAVEDYATFYAFLKKNGLKLSKDTYERRYNIGEELLERFLQVHSNFADRSPMQSGDILVVERQDAMEAFEEWARDNYGRMTLTALEKEFGINSSKAKQLELRAARASRETAAREATLREEADRRVAAEREEADRRVAAEREEAQREIDRRVAEARREAVQAPREAATETVAAEAPLAEAEQRAEVARREAPPARIEVPRVESDSDSDFESNLEPEPPKRSEKKRKRTSTSGGGDDGQGAAKRRCALENKTFFTAFRWFCVTFLPAAGVYGWYAVRG